MASCFAQPSILRKPLLKAEREAGRKTILVTGGTGYIGSRVVERLLACGHNVSVLCRPRDAPGPEDMLTYLQLLPGAAKHLKIVSGDVTDAAALATAMQDCQQLVHLAAVVDVRPPRDEQHKQQMLDTALEGTRLVLDAATAAGSIGKVLIASSIVSVMWDWWERASDYIYTEDDWTLDSSVALNCYAYCKRESERLAYKMAVGQSWELATINPGIVFGPVPARKLAHSASVWTPIVEHMNGTKYPFTSNLYVSHVDLDDVAAAICGLLATPGAAGRHLLMSGKPPSMPQIAQLLSAAYPLAKVPYLTAPGPIVALLAKLSPHKLGFDIHKFWAMHNKPYSVDASKIQRVLPDFSYIPLEASVRAAADSVVALGLVEFREDSSSGCCWGFNWNQGLSSPASLLDNNATAAMAAALAAVADSTRASAMRVVAAAGLSAGGAADGEQQGQQHAGAAAAADTALSIQSKDAVAAHEGELEVVAAIIELSGTMGKHSTMQAPASQEVQA